MGKHRVKKFLTKWNQEGQRGEDYAEYLKVDRIIDEGELVDPVTGEPSIYYLVKWNGQFYDASTWESEEDVQKVIMINVYFFYCAKTEEIYVYVYVYVYVYIDGYD